MKDEQAKRLRDPFPAEQVGKLPRLTCKACIDGKGQCSQHSKQKCAVCGAYISPQHIHLDYVGHAAVTDRLLQVDPEWSWEPMALGPNGEPLSTNGGLWIKLTIAGVTRPGFGDGNSQKEIIGDAIRNAAMRFGVALDLWAKENLHDEKPLDENGGGATFIAPAQTEKPRTDAQNRHFRALISELEKNLQPLPDGVKDWTDYAKAFIATKYGKESSTQLTQAEASELIEDLKKRKEGAPF